MTKSDLPTLSIRLDLPGGSRFGPGKAALLRAIQAKGSIASAARSLEMSYPRALKLIEAMNTQFTAPLITTHQGGAMRGGAEITELGTQILSSYEDLTAMCTKAGTTALLEFRAHCRRT